VKLITHLYLGPELESVDVHLFSPYTPAWHAQGPDRRIFCNINSVGQLTATRSAPKSARGVLRQGTVVNAYSMSVDLQ